MRLENTVASFFKFIYMEKVNEASDRREKDTERLVSKYKERGKK